MKNRIAYLFNSLVLLTMPIFVHAQGAGNYQFNQEARSGKAGLYGDKIANSGSYNWQPAAQTAQSYIVSNGGDTVIALNARVLINITPDAYVMILGASQVAATIDSCQQILDKRITRFLRSAEKAGLKTGDHFVDFISQVPVFSYEEEKKLFSKSYHEVPAGFEVQKNIHLKFRDNKLAGKLMLLAAKEEIYDIIKVDPIILDRQAVYDTLRKAALAVLKKKTTDFTAAGISFAPLYQTVSESYNASYPLYRYDRYGSFNEMSTVSVSKFTGRSLSGSRVSMPPYLYYNRLPYDMYDEVIHPVVFRPVVQVSYTLQMKYVLKKRN